MPTFRGDFPGEMMARCTNEEGDVSEFDVRLQVDLLMKEYDTLRTEILARSRERFALASATMGIVMAKVDVLATRRGYLLLAFVVTLGVALVVLRLGDLLKRCSDRVSEIERHVNRVAMCPELLKWEGIVAGEGAFHKFYGRGKKAVRTGILVVLMVGSCSILYGIPDAFFEGVTPSHGDQTAPSKTNSRSERLPPK